MAKFECSFSGNSTDFIENLLQSINSMGFTMKLVDESTTSLSSVTIYNYAFEKYFMRVNSYAALFVNIVVEKEMIYVVVMSAGAKETFFTDFGVESDLINDVARIIRDYNNQ